MTGQSDAGVTQLLPCPRCGSRAFVTIDFGVMCERDRCLALPPRDDREQAIAAWNTRQQAIAQHEGDEKPVDWSAPLEAVNRKTGDVRRIENVCTDYNEDPVTEGSFAVGDDFIGGWNCFSADGKNEDPDHCDWDIRNTRHASTPATPAQDHTDRLARRMGAKFEDRPEECPSCGGLNTSCPHGCGRDENGELDGSTLVTPAQMGEGEGD